MNRLIFLCLIFISFYESKIHSLSDENFKNFIDTHKIVFLKVYANWCGHSKTLKPYFEELARKYNKNNLIFAESDGDSNP